MDSSCLVGIIYPELHFPQKQYSLPSSGLVMFGAAKAFAGEQTSATILREWVGRIECRWEGRVVIVLRWQRRCGYVRMSAHFLDWRTDDSTSFGLCETCCVVVHCLQGRASVIVG